MLTETTGGKVSQFQSGALAPRLRELERQFCTLTLMALLFAGGCAPQATSADAAAIVRIEQLGGKVQLDPDAPEHRVIKVYLHDTSTTDSDLAILADLNELQILALGHTSISDPGLEHLRGLANLKTLSLNGAAITDAGLKHLSGLKRLKTLNLHETRVTAAGIARLKGALPQLRVAH